MSLWDDMLAEMQTPGSGWVERTEFTYRTRTLRPGLRVHNQSEQYSEAFEKGTATIVSIWEHPDDSWSRTYGRPNVEVLVRHDDGSERFWADYGTRIAEVQS